MTSDTATLVLDGDDLSLDDFARAMDNFSRLVWALNVEVAENSTIRWTIDSLDRSSAVVTVRGAVESGDSEAVHEVLRGFETVGAALQERRPVPYSLKVQSAADQLVSLLDSAVEALRMETEDDDFIVTRIEKPPTSPPTGVSANLPKLASYGGIEGRIQTLTNRGGLRFTLYDTINDKAVACYLAPGQEDTLRGLWGRRVVVEGVVRREPLTGRPLTVRQITAVVPRLETDIPRAWTQARGALPHGPNDLPAEAMIRRMRDA